MPYSCKRHDVCVLQSRREFGLAFEARSLTRRGQRTVEQDLDGDVALGRALPRPVDRPLAAVANTVQDFVSGQRFPQKGQVSVERGLYLTVRSLGALHLACGRRRRHLNRAQSPQAFTEFGH